MDSAGSLDAALLAQARGDARAILHGQYRPGSGTERGVSWRLARFESPKDPALRAKVPKAPRATGVDLFPDCGP